MSFADSSPAMRTTFPLGNDVACASDTLLTQKTDIQPGGQQETEVKFPKSIRHNGKGQVWAKIYAKTESYPLYRVTWSVKANGKKRRVIKAFGTYAEAKKFADARAKDLASGSRVTALTPGQADDALAAFEKLADYYRQTGRKVSLLASVSEYVENALRLAQAGRSLSEAVDGFLRTVVSVKRMNIAKAVEDFIKAEQPRTAAKDGKRPDLSPKYHYNRAIMLRRFAQAFPGTAFADLGKEHLDLFIISLASLNNKSKNRKAIDSPKSRNHHRAAIRQLFDWAVRKDYLSATHRLGEADGLRPERANTSEVLFYTAAEFNSLLQNSEGPMHAMIAIGGLAGLRTAELLRLTWEDVYRIEGHIEVTSGKSKTRQRRLVEIVPALVEWLEPFKEFKGKLWTAHEITFQQHFCEVCDAAKVKRKANGLRHAFCTYHFALNGNENLTAMQAGNSPEMVHGHYKGLATKKEGEAWFTVAPKQPGNVVSLSDAKIA